MAALSDCRAPIWSIQDGDTTPHVFENAITRLRAKESTIEVVYASHNWPPSLSFPDDGGGMDSYRVAVLDSSFNPPTRAHLALALAAVSPSSACIATLLLLSVRNADKQLKPGDASHVQRLQMMVLLAQEIERIISARNGDSQTTTWLRGDSSKHCVAVAAIDEPTFVGKSSILIDHLSKNAEPSSPPLSVPTPRLTFILGWDTIIRFFDPKYYPSLPAMSDALHRFFGKERSAILCARRPESAGSDEEVRMEDRERSFFASENVRSFVELDSTSIQMIDIGAAEVAVSSTLVRRGIAAGINGENGGWREMTITSVAKFIEAKQLYTGSGAPLRVGQFTHRLWIGYLTLKLVQVIETR